MRRRRSSTTRSVAEVVRGRKRCRRTGLALTPGPSRAVRVARQSYGPLDPIERRPDSPVEGWSRYDTLGRTVYACAARQTAYMELLAPYRSDVNRERQALQPVADHMGIPLETLWAEIVDDWERAGTAKANRLPTVFREGRALYTLEFPEGWWADIAATETLTALDDLFADSWGTSVGLVTSQLTLQHITSDDRSITTAIATLLREYVTLEDETAPLGIEFPSKHGHPADGTGACWAYWMRGRDAGLTEGASVVRIDPIEATDPAYRAVLDFCKIRSR